jgi:ArsR family transcriptional regulator
MGDRDVQLISAALADPTRYRLFELICGCESVSSQELCELLDVSPATISHHLRQLRLAALVESVRDGRWRHHKARRPTLNGYVAALSRLGSEDGDTDVP